MIRSRVPRPFSVIMDWYQHVTTLERCIRMAQRAEGRSATISPFVDVKVRMAVIPSPPHLGDTGLLGLY